MCFQTEPTEFSKNGFTGNTCYLKQGTWGILKHFMGVKAGIRALRLRLRLLGWHLGHRARIQALRLGFGPQGWSFDLKARFRALRLEFGTQGWN